MLKALVTDINTVEEAHRGFYEEKDGKFYLKVTPTDGFALEDVSGLRSALSAERTFKAETEKKLKSFEGLDPALARQAIERVAAFGDLTPEQAKEAKETAARLSALDPGKEAERLAEEKVKVREEQLQKAFSTREKELADAAEAAKAASDALKNQLKKLMVDNVITSELAKLNPLDDARDALALLAERSIRTREVDGQIVVEVVDDKGIARIKDHHSTPVTVAELLSELRESKPALFQADKKDGMGMKPGQQTPSGTTIAGHSGPNPFAKETRNITEQMKITRENPKLAQQLKAAAGVK